MRSNDQAVSTPFHRFSGLGRFGFYAKDALMNAGILPQAHDLVLQLQFSPLQFHDFQVIRGWMGKCFVDFVFQRSVLLFQFRKMRLNCHVAFLLAQIGCLTRKLYTKPEGTATLVLVVRRSNPPLGYHSLSGFSRLESTGTNRDNFPGDGLRQGRPHGSAMAVTPDEERELRDQLARLLQEHRDLDTAIEALQDTPGSDLLQVQRLKKRKLYLRDRISFIEDQLTPDIIA
jgi:hypothetical protein